jgi:hypothetical protein
MECAAPGSIADEKVVTIVDDTRLGFGGYPGNRRARRTAFEAEPAQGRWPLVNTALAARHPAGRVDGGPFGRPIGRATIGSIAAGEGRGVLARRPIAAERLSRCRSARPLTARGRAGRMRRAELVSTGDGCRSPARLAPMSRRRSTTSFRPTSAGSTSTAARSAVRPRVLGPLAAGERVAIDLRRPAPIRAAAPKTAAIDVTGSRTASGQPSRAPSPARDAGSARRPIAASRPSCRCPARALDRGDLVRRLAIAALSLRQPPWPRTRSGGRRPVGCDAPRGARPQG